MGEYHGHDSQGRESCQSIEENGNILGPLILPKGRNTTPHFEVEFMSGVKRVVPLDLGADSSLISSDFFNKLKESNPEMRIIPDCARLYDVSGKRVQSEGRCWLKIKFGHVQLQHPVYVCEINADVLIGADVLWRIGSLVDLVNGVLRSGIKEPIEFQSDWRGIQTVQLVPDACQVEVVETTIVPKFTDAQRVCIKLAKNQDIGGREGVVQASRGLEEMGLELLDCLIPTERRWAWVYVRNRTGKDITLAKSKRIGHVIAKDAPAFETNIPVLGDLEGLSLGTSDSSVGSKEKESFFSIRRVLGPNGVPLSDDDIVKCIAEEESLNLILKEGSEEAAIDTGQGSAGSIDIGVVEPYPDFDHQIEEVLRRGDAMDDAQKEELRELLTEYRHIFAVDKYDVGSTNVHKVSIPTTPGTEPVYTKQYKIPLGSYDQIGKIVKELETREVIRKCNSPYNSPIWPVLKSNGSWRLCLDFRNLNNKVPLSRWPMGDIEKALAEISGAKFLTTIDAANGFWTLPVQDTDQHKLAFTFNNKQYTWRRCPFGYKNSPAEWNIFLQKVIPDMQERHLASFVDDMLIPSSTWDHHKCQIRYVLEKLSLAGVKIPLSKCQWGRKGVNFVGYHITEEGISPQQSKISAITKIKDPTGVRELRGILGMLNFMRKFIKEYSRIAEPLHRLTKKGVPWHFGNAEREALQELKDRLCSAPVLGFPRFGTGAEFIVECASSGKSLGAILSQEQEGVQRVIAYASKSLNDVESSYSDCEKSCYAVTWALLHFQTYLCGHHAIVKTAHHPVTFLDSKKSHAGLSGKVARWALVLQGQSMSVVYRKNANMKHVEGLSEIHNCCSSEVSHEEARAENIHHREWDSNVCRDFVMVYADGSAAKNDDGELMAGAGITWKDREQSSSFHLGKVTSQYAELAAAMIAILQAREQCVKDLVLATDSAYVVNVFLRFLPVWKMNSMKNARGKEVKNSMIILVIDKIVSQAGMTIHWKKVKGHSSEKNGDGSGNNHADSLAKNAVNGNETWSLDEYLETEPQLMVELKTEVDIQQVEVEPEGASYDFYPTEPDQDLIEAQAADADIARMISYVEDKVDIPPEELHSELKVMYQRKEKFMVKDKLLFYTKQGDGKVYKYLVIPKSYRPLVMWHMHDHPTAGHRGIQTTYRLLTKMVYWPNMFKDVKLYVSRCAVCCTHLPKSMIQRAPLQPTLAKYPWSEIMLDFVGPVTKSSRGHKYILVIVDLFSKYVEALPAKNVEAETVARLLTYHVFSRWGLPMRMRSDRGTHFTAGIIKELCKMLHIQHKLHVAWHPESAGAVERTNRTVVEILKKYVTGVGKDWDIALPLVLMALRSTEHASTGLSPHEIMTGRQMVMPYHLAFSMPEVVEGYDSPYTYVSSLQEGLRKAYAMVRNNLGTAARVRKTHYDKTATHREYEIYNKVYYFNFMRRKSKQKKFLPCWTGPYRIVRKCSPVAYEIATGRGKKRWVHVNQLRPAWRLNNVRVV